jgi:segregation and condensation protein A
MEEYKYKVSDFEGPLDLLLYLIEKNKVDIYNIPIVEIADQFNEYVAQIDTFDVNYASKFFLMAATLLQIKSRLLLPKQTAPVDEEEENPQDVLVRQLLEYKRMKQISSVLATMWEQRSRMLDRPQTPLPYEPQFTGDIDKQALFDAFRVAYQALPEKEVTEIHIQQEEYSVDECMQRVAVFLRQAGGAVAVLDVFRPCRTKVELVVTFLAVLELLKQGQCSTVSAGEDGNTIALRFIPKREA